MHRPSTSRLCSRTLCWWSSSLALLLSTAAMTASCSTSRRSGRGCWTSRYRVLHHAAVGEAAGHQGIVFYITPQFERLLDVKVLCSTSCRSGRGRCTSRRIGRGRTPQWGGYSSSIQFKRNLSRFFNCRCGLMQPCRSSFLWARVGEAWLPWLPTTSSITTVSGKCAPHPIQHTMCLLLSISTKYLIYSI